MALASEPMHLVFITLTGEHDCWLDCHILRLLIPDVLHRTDHLLIKGVNHLIWLVDSTINVPVDIISLLWLELVVKELLLSQLLPDLL